MSGTLSYIPAFSTSPNTCGIMGLMNAGSIFDQSIIGTANELINQVGGLSAAISSIPSGILDEIDIDITGMVASLEGSITSAVSGLINHLTSQLTNLVSNLSLAVSALSAQLGLANSGCNLPTLAGAGVTPNNPCVAMQTFFGSITGLGASLINSMSATVGTAISAVESLAGASIGELQGIADSITAGVQMIGNIAVGVTDMVASEIASLASVAIDMLNFSATNTLLSLLNNPCAAMVINSSATPELLGFLGG